MESFNQLPLANVAPSYLYFQYSDDDDLQAFVSSYNEIAQGYVDWFNNTPLGVYTSPYITGALLDWIGLGVYGIERPYLSSVVNDNYGSVNTFAVNEKAINDFVRNQSGTSQAVNDDYYKRVITWHTYRGDGYQASIFWLKKRIARFLYGSNGSDISLNQINNVSISIVSLKSAGAINTSPVNTFAINQRSDINFTPKHTLTITIPNTAAALAFETLLNEGYFSIPFQITYRVVRQ